MEFSPNVCWVSLLVCGTLFLAGCQGLVGSPFQVTVTPAGAGSGTVTSAPAGIDCGKSCTATIDANKAITLTASPAAGSVFVGWSGACSGTGPCTISSTPASVTATFGATLQSIHHIVFMMQENRTFDHYFGMLNPYRKANGWDVGEDGKTYNVDGIDDKLTTISNPDDEGSNFSLFKLKSTCIDDDSSAWLQSYGDVNRYDFLLDRPISMDGFVHTAEGYAKYCAVPSNNCTGGQFTDLTGERAMGYYDQGFLNYYYFMASQFALSDRWFSPVASESVPNRIATMTGGTTQGLVHDPGSNEDKLGVQLDIETIFQELDNAGVSWRIYYSTTEDQCPAGDGDCGNGQPINKFPATTFTNFTYSLKYVYANRTGIACAPPTQGSAQAVGDPNNAFCIDIAHVAPISQFFTDLTDGKLQAFSWIDPGYSNNDEHPGSGQSILAGQAQMASILNAFMGSSSWKDSIFFWSYDEGGGPYDHVPPVPNHTNDNTDPALGITTDISSIAVNPDQYKPCVPANSTNTPALHCDLRTSPPNTNADPGANPEDAPAQEGFAAQLGFRLPNMVISAFTRKHYVSHTPMDHTAVIKFVENRFIGPSAHLTQRDAAQPDMTEFFDFAHAPSLKPPTPPAPVTATSLGYNPCTPAEMGP